MKSKLSIIKLGDIEINCETRKFKIFNKTHRITGGCKYRDGEDEVYVGVRSIANTSNNIVRYRLSIYQGNMRDLSEYKILMTNREWISLEPKIFETYVLMKMLDLGTQEVDIGIPGIKMSVWSHDGKRFKAYIIIEFECIEEEQGA